MYGSEKILMGIPVSDWRRIAECALHCPAVSEIIIYGSRARGDFRRFSDIDITLKGEGLKHDDLFQIYNDIDDLLLPYMIDLSIFTELDHPPLIDEINHYGVALLPLLQEQIRENSTTPQPDCLSLWHSQFVAYRSV